jgi:hypothetical protein
VDFVRRDSRRRWRQSGVALSGLVLISLELHKSIPSAWAALFYVARGRSLRS